MNIREQLANPNSALSVFFRKETISTARIVRDIQNNAAHSEYDIQPQDQPSISQINGYILHGSMNDLFDEAGIVLPKQLPHTHKYVEPCFVWGNYLIYTVRNFMTVNDFLEPIVYLLLNEEENVDTLIWYHARYYKLTVKTTGELFRDLPAKRQALQAWLLEWDKLITKTFDFDFLLKG